VAAESQTPPDIKRPGGACQSQIAATLPRSAGIRLLPRRWPPLQAGPRFRGAPLEFCAQAARRPLAGPGRAGLGDGLP